MPYTPPSQQSPASSKSSSPVISRSSSYHQDDNVPRSPVSRRPQPPRSQSSASYLHKHRRSPSIPKSDNGGPPTPVDQVSALDFATMNSLRQSPPPRNNLRIPTGAVISPPDSSENSDGDEGSNERGRELEKNWDELQQAVRALPQQREGSPDKGGKQLSLQTKSEPSSQVTSPIALSATARKISHSRSSTETKIMLKNPTFSESPTQTSDDSEDDDGNPLKPALVRKKSGELVKPALRPSSRRRYSSMPGTPTYSKSVHFNDSDNQTRHFLQVDKPIAVSAGTSPVEAYEGESEFPFTDESAKPELEIRVSNYPEDSFTRRTKPVRLERIFLSADKTTLVGICAVQNISFQKLVVARFTLDYWKTTSEVAADFNHDVRSPPNDGCDRFNFHIKLTDQANIDSKTLLLCIRYDVGGQTLWDNNDGTNYQVDFSRTQPEEKQVKKTVQHSPLGQRPLNAIPRSRHNASSPRGRQESVDDDFVSRLDTSSAYSFGTPSKFLGDSPSNTIKLKPKSKRPAFPASGPPTATNGLGSRYDFGNSLSAALSSAQEKLGRQSGLMNGSGPEQAGSSYFPLGPVDRVEPSKPEITARPEAITSDRPAMGSEQYKDLVQKFCYFTPGTGIGKVASPLQASASKFASSQQQKSPPSTDGTQDAELASSSDSSAASSPNVSTVAAKDRACYSPSLAPFMSRSQSPVPTTGQDLGSRSASSISFGYPYHSSHRDGYLSDTPTPTAILG